MSLEIDTIRATLMDWVSGIVQISNDRLEFQTLDEVVQFMQQMTATQTIYIYIHVAGECALASKSRGKWNTSVSDERTLLDVYFTHKLMQLEAEVNDSSHCDGPAA